MLIPKSFLHSFSDKQIIFYNPFSVIRVLNYKADIKEIQYNMKAQFDSRIIKSSPLFLQRLDLQSSTLVEQLTSLNP